MSLHLDLFPPSSSPSLAVSRDKPKLLTCRRRSPHALPCLHGSHVRVGSQTDAAFEQKDERMRCEARFAGKQGGRVQETDGM